MSVYNPAGYNLREIEKNVWELEVIGQKPKLGTFLEIALQSVLLIGLNISEVEKAIEVMISNSHDVAHFGMNGMFLYSFTYKSMTNHRMMS
jgi:hypothetical protein